MNNTHCENCNDKYSRLTVFTKLKDPKFIDLCLCEKCAELPLSQIKRKKKRELRRIEGSKPVTEERGAC